MASQALEESIKHAFPGHWTRILAAIEGERTDLTLLFGDLSKYVLHLLYPTTQPDPNPKKRKLEGEPENSHVVRKSADVVAPPIFQCIDVSVQVPVRKKLKVELVRGDGKVIDGSLRLVNQASNLPEHSLSTSEVDEVFCLPTPDKQVRQANFVFFPKNGSHDSLAGKPAEQVVFVMNDAPVSGAMKFQGISSNEEDTCITITQRALDFWLSKWGKRVVTPNANEFASSITQSHRKGEKAYHVRAHRGSKEGYLFFLENGIVFGFKKPLAFFPFSSIDSISYTSVLQRTFNLVIAARDGDSDEVKEIEFSMLDQEDFAGIDAYIKKHGLNDASMAAQRRAKAYNVNKERKAEGAEDVNGGVEAEDGQTELQKAEQQLQDEEDDLEEDYEVSGGESEGEGEESEEEEEAYDEEEVDEEDAEQEE